MKQHVRVHVGSKNKRRKRKILHHPQLKMKRGEGRYKRGKHWQSKSYIQLGVPKQVQ